MALPLRPSGTSPSFGRGGVFDATNYTMTQ